MTQQREIDRLTYNKVVLQIKAEENSNANRFQVASLTIEVQSVNEYPPEITSNINEFTGYILENSPPGTLVKDILGQQALRLVINDRDQVKLF